MKRQLLALLAGLCLAQLAGAREITDMAGRKVNVPDRIERVFGSAPPLNVLLHAVAPESMLGLSFPVTEENKAFFPPRLQTLPVVGGIFGMGQQMNPETVLAMKPDIALAWKSPFIDQAKIEGAFAKIGVPVVFIQLDVLADWPAALRYTGQLLGHEKTAEAQAQYIEQRLARVAKAIKAIPENQRLKVYYAEGPDGLATDCHRSFHTEAIELAGGYNVYRCEPKDHTGMERISLEQVLALAPEVIITQDPAVAANIRQEARWLGVPAVKNGNIHVVPRWPHNWVDRPPSMMRVLGVQWLANLFYPKTYPLDLRRETREFYQLFLGTSLDEAALSKLLQFSEPTSSQPKPKKQA
ncbi:MAG: ABC transporter substrate-binding protein [Azonexus sp.]